RCPADFFSLSLPGGSSGQARGRQSICGRPPACKAFGQGAGNGSLASICPACWVRSRETAGQDEIRVGSSAQGRDVEAPLDCPECLPSWIDRSPHLLVCLQGPASAGSRSVREGRAAGPAELSGGGGQGGETGRVVALAG